MMYSQTFFNGIQKTYNPVKNGCPINSNSGQNEGEAELINEIRALMCNHGM
jgi:hypothetical protein